jgi:hypothetical protein
MFDPDGDQAAADSTRSSTTLDTGSSLNPRTARRLVTASYTSMIAYLPPKHSGTNATSLVFISNPLDGVGNARGRGQVRIGELAADYYDDAGFSLRIGQISDGFPYYIHLICCSTICMQTSTS